MKLCKSTCAYIEIWFILNYGCRESLGIHATCVVIHSGFSVAEVIWLCAPPPPHTHGFWELSPSIVAAVSTPDTEPSPRLCFTSFKVILQIYFVSIYLYVCVCVSMPVYVSAGVHGGQKVWWIPCSHCELYIGQCVFWVLWKSSRNSQSQSHVSSPIFYILSVQSTWIISQSS